jgi:hypothetical protein
LDWSKIQMSLKFGITLTSLIWIQTGALWPRAPPVAPPSVSPVRTPLKHAPTLVAPPDHDPSPPWPPAPTSSVRRTRGSPLSSPPPGGALNTPSPAHLATPSFKREHSPSPTTFSSHPLRSPDRGAPPSHPPFYFSSIPVTRALPPPPGLSPPPMSAPPFR